MQVFQYYIITNINKDFKVDQISCLPNACMWQSLMSQCSLLVWFNSHDRCHYLTNIQAIRMLHIIIIWVFSDQLQKFQEESFGGFFSANISTFVCVLGSGKYSFIDTSNL